MGSITPYETLAGKRYRVRYRKPDRGQTDKRGFKTKKAAELFLASIEVSKARGDFVEASRARVTVGDWGEQWLAAQVQLKPSTYVSYQSIMRARIIPKWGQVPLGELTHSGLQSWISEQVKRVSPRTVRYYHRVFSMMLKYAVRDGRISRNVADGILLPRIVQRKHGYLTHAQLHELAAYNGTYRDLVLFFGYTGLRWGEATAVRVRDLDMLRRRVSVEQAVVLIGSELVYGTPKNHTLRSVPFPAFLAEDLAARCQGKALDDLVFTAPKGGPLMSRNWRIRTFTPAMVKLRAAHPSLPRLTPHDLRHTAASLAISAGANVKAVQRMLGHKSAAMTLDVYSDLFDDDLDAVGDALSAAGDPSVVGTPWAERAEATAKVTVLPA
ncbi:tyrosine-type recombinase/integrase [Cryobacterium sp. HLT2-28]|uniref:tyrosine-type recombinase/integrase n=1 Tax=Cryobacterium sp. HLT2-28 TaxID=1259146 RepID=UPI00106B9EEF|nr:tyrosine-type recombinase/integrase [Cryobacterium sp. HLT2-28]TFB93189.1 site-specific integrase [Cryobacterium sp. HLT2-28]